MAAEHSRVGSGTSSARTLAAGAAHPLRVAIVTETFLPKMDGIVRFLLEMLAYLRRHGYEAIIFCPGPGVDRATSFPVVRASGLPFPLYPELCLTLRSRRMVGALRRWRPDVLHLAGPVLLGAQGLRVGRLLGVPVVGHFQTNLPQYVRHYGAPWLAPVVWRYLVALHNRCACTYTPTEIVAVDCRQHGMQRVQALPRGVDSAAFAPHFRNEVLRRSWGVREGQVVFLYAGRLALEKNLLRLAELPQAVPASRLVIVGDGPYRAALAARLGPAAHFTGHLQGEALAAAFASADVFAFPSLTETFGLVVLEAMASGVPVLAMRAGGVRAVVEDGQTGLLCDPSAPMAWVDGARRLANSAPLRRLFAVRGRSAALGRSWDVTFDRLLTDYAHLAGRRVSEGGA